MTMDLDRASRASSLPHTWTNGASQKPRPELRYATGYVYDAIMLEHRELEVDEDGTPHPEQPARILAIYRAIKDSGYLQRMQLIKIREATQQEIELVHSPEQWARVAAMAAFDEIQIEATKAYYQRQSLYLNPNSPLCARFSCGGVIETCRAVVEGDVRNAFAIVRPPGHHAEPEREMGFCFFNNVAVAAKWIRTCYPTKVKKVLVLDWDVHHGNGTQKAFWDDPSILYISVHLFLNGSFYPGGPDGALDQVGSGAAAGTNVNIPWEAELMGNADYLYAFQKIVMPIAYEFAPDLIIVSAGYDAAAGDPLGCSEVTPAGFAHMTHMLSCLANGKLVLALEGGYNLDVIATSALECVKVLLGESPPQLGPMNASESATAVVYSVALEQSRYWKAIKPEAPEPKSELEKAVSTVPLSHILKAHRANYLYHTAGLVNTELADPDLQATFEDQVFCSENVYEAETLLLFVHDLGTVHAEIGAMNFDVHLEKTYMIDSTQKVIEWAVMQDFGIIDVNIMTRAPLRRARLAPLREQQMDDRQLAIFVWDNFIQLGQAKNVILMGMGAGCQALTYVINFRTTQVQSLVKASVMVCGRLRPPILLDNKSREGLRSWYYHISQIICPSTHELVQPEEAKVKRFGHLVNSQESRPLHVLHATLSSIFGFISKQLLASNNAGR